MLDLLGKPATQDAVKLLHDGIRVLSEMTCNGFPVDTSAIQENIRTCNRLMSEIEEHAWSIEGGTTWKKRYGSAATLSNTNQAKDIFFGHLGFSPSKDGEDDVSESLDKDALADIDHPLADIVARYRKIDKCANTFLKSLLVEGVNGWVHPFFSLSRASSYRSSSTDPNGQNMPIRDPEVAAFVRKAIKAPPGFRLVESDYSGIEVSVANCYHKDPTMTTYLASGYDMHRDMARECYLIEGEDPSYWEQKTGKKVRYSSKNGFVFPEFYGSFWRQVAVSLWKNMTRLNLMAPDGESLLEHMKSKGIYELGHLHLDKHGEPTKPEKGSFYAHIENVEKRFWNERFPVYSKWRKDWYAMYQKRGYFTSLTGFNYAGLFRRNQVINLPVQGSASHLKLKALINMYEAIRKRKMQSRLILEIHDSVIGLVPDDEFEAYCQLIQEQQVQRINEQFKWIVVPVKAEIEASPSGGSWYEKKVVPIE